MSGQGMGRVVDWVGHGRGSWVGGAVKWAGQGVGGALARQVSRWCVGWAVEWA